MADIRGETSNLLAVGPPSAKRHSAASAAPRRSGERIARVINECREYKREIYKWRTERDSNPR